MHSHFSRRRLLLITTALLLAGLLTAGMLLNSRSPLGDTPFASRLQDFARQHELSLREWPAALIELGERNPEAADFVLRYPLIRDTPPPESLPLCLDQDSVPLLLQWDERWGALPYSGGMMARTGCGPTCLSMVALHLLRDPALTPAAIAAFSEENGYAEPGSGSKWTLISRGGPELGLTVTELPLDEGRIRRELDRGHPVICVLGPGDFTASGHFVVLTEYREDGLCLLDPNSPRRSRQRWDYERLAGQIRNLWACEA